MQIKIKIKQVLIFLLIPVLLATLGFGCKRSCSPKPGGIALKEVELNFWGIFTESAQMEPIIQAFQAEHPNIKIKYRNFGNDYQNYHNEIVNALAAGKGPDIWTGHHTWLLRDKNLLKPCPPEIIDINNYKEAFVDAVIKDNIIDNSIYGVPLSLDTLALFYNKDLFNQAHIIAPPTDWETFKEDVQKLARQNEKGQITEAGTALGTAKNINRAPDILALLMLQNGAKMTDPEHTRATFNELTSDPQAENYSPGEEALTFYTEFASPKKAVYTWNPLQHYSIDAFVEGVLATMFSYSYHLPTVKLKAPNLNFGVSPMPQISGGREVNFANYWTNVVSASTKYPQEAWTFLAFAAQEKAVRKFCELTRRPPSRRDLFNMFDEDPELKVFTHQILTAETWIRKDNDAVDDIFEDMIEDVVLGKKTTQEAIDFATAQVTQTMK